MSAIAIYRQLRLFLHCERLSTGPLVVIARPEIALFQAISTPPENQPNVLIREALLSVPWTGEPIHATIGPANVLQFSYMVRAQDSEM